MDMARAFEGWRWNDGAPAAAIHRAEAVLKCALPADYTAFLRMHDGGEGFLGKGFLMLWSVTELQMLNDGYEVHLHAPGILLFGSSGEGAAYGFDFRSGDACVVRVPFVGLGLDRVEKLADRFAEFLTTLETQ
ncbi:MAG: SMI1/KNR4 family protein [Candidatus Dactylopiibacterium sp.]|nr:SMI1/KNR4 family protein [Candidatus Dactylopiibacterium sp.]